MFPFHWLTTLQQQYRSRFRQGARFRQHRSRHACPPCIARATPRHAVELLEDRTLLTAFTVVNTDDTGAGSLRDAIEQANANEGADTISFDAALAGQTIILSSELLISDNVTITGLGAEQLLISGNHNSRIFNIDDGDKNITITVEISGLTLTQGHAENGGAILNNEILSITDSVISLNAASLNGGGIYHAAGLLTITDTLFADNRANQDGGGLYNSTQDLEISGSTFLRNVADRNGGGVYTLQGVARYGIQGPPPVSAYPGDVIQISSLYPSIKYQFNLVTISDTRFIENSAQNGGGLFSGYTSGPAINYYYGWYKPIIISIPPSVIEGASENVNTERNKTEFFLTDSTFIGNYAVNGGGVYHGAGLLEMKRNSIHNNLASNSGGGIANYGNLIIDETTLSENTARFGGGVFQSGGTLTMKNSTLSNNSATHSGGGIFQTDGSPQLLYPEDSQVDLVVLSDLETMFSVSLIEEAPYVSASTNTIDDWRFSSYPILFSPSSTLNIINSTITGNRAAHSGGGIATPARYNQFTTTTISNSIIAGNTAAAFAQVEGSFVFNSNIIQNSIEGLLDPVLRDNGGPTKTHALLPGSAAIDAGSNQAASEAGLITDQRGEGSQRFKEGTVDIGAFEVQAPFTQVDFRFANSNSRKLNNGEQEQLPENRIWLDEAGNYWVEIWLQTPTSTTAGIQSGYFDLHYNTSAATAVSIEYGAAFAQNQSGTINQNTGTIENLSAETSRTDIGDDQYTLFARIQFHANMAESTDGERGRHPRTSVVNPGITVTQLNIRLTGGAASEAIVNQSPGDLIWENLQPASDNPAFDDLVLANLQFDYYVQPDNFFAASHISPNNEYAYHSGLTLIDLPGSPVVDQAGNETDMLNELDSLVGSRDETEDDLPKKAPSADHDSSAEEDSDRFFTDLTEETELIVF